LGVFQVVHSTETATAVAIDDFDPVSAERAEKQQLYIRWEYIAIFLIVAGIRFRLRDFPLERTKENTRRQDN
jgi:hypothetical protein